MGARHDEYSQLAVVAALTRALRLARSFGDSLVARAPQNALGFTRLATTLAHFPGITGSCY